MKSRISPSSVMCLALIGVGFFAATSAAQQGQPAQTSENTDAEIQALQDKLSQLKQDRAKKQAEAPGKDETALEMAANKSHPYDTVIKLLSRPDCKADDALQAEWLGNARPFSAQSAQLGQKANLIMNELFDETRLPGHPPTLFKKMQSDLAEASGGKAVLALIDDKDAEPMIVRGKAVYFWHIYDKTNKLGMIWNSADGFGGVPIDCRNLAEP